MACATLKRSLDWESINQRPTKRQRFNPFGKQPSPDLNKSSSSTSCSVQDGNAMTMVRSPRTFMNELQPSAFEEASPSKISPETMEKNIRVEIKRLHKRKQLPMSMTAIERMQDSESSGSEMGAESPLRPESPPSLVRNPEKALFTFKQVQLICRRMLQEREDELREKYDVVLTTKLAEQYDAFVKFTYDQIQRRYQAAPSYLS